jgi:hypothetical protein
MVGTHLYLAQESRLSIARILLNIVKVLLLIRVFVSSFDSFFPLKYAEIFGLAET